MEGDTKGRRVRHLDRGLAFSQTPCSSLALPPTLCYLLLQQIFVTEAAIT